MFPNFRNDLRTMLNWLPERKSSVPRKRAMEPFDRAFYDRAVHLEIKGYVTFEVMKKFGLESSRVHDSKRIVIVLDSEGCEEGMVTIMRGLIRKLCEGSDVRLVARGTCASSSILLVMAMPRHRRYAAQGLKLWMDAELAKAQASIGAPISSENLANVPPPGVRRDFPLPRALSTGLFTGVVDWL